MTPFDEVKPVPGGGGGAEDRQAAHLDPGVGTGEVGERHPHQHLSCGTHLTTMWLMKESHPQCTVGIAQLHCWSLMEPAGA